MARASRGRGRFHRRSRRANSTAWVTTILDSVRFNPGDSATDPNPEWQRFPLVMSADWVRNELLAEKATLVRVVGNLVFQPAGTTSGATDQSILTWQSMWGNVFAGDLADEDLSLFTNQPNNPDYYLENDVMASVVRGCASHQTQGNETGFVSGGYSNISSWNLNIRTKRKLAVDTVIWLDLLNTTPFGPLAFGDWSNTGLSVDGVIRSLIRFGT